MSVTGIQSNYALDFWLKQQTEASGYNNSGKVSSQASSTNNSTLSSLNKFSSSYGSNSLISQLQSSISVAMNQLGLKSGDRITFSAMNEARQQMEATFSEKVREDLKKLGVNVNVEFSFVSNDKGGISVIMDEGMQKYTRNLGENKSMQSILDSIGLDKNMAFSLNYDGKGNFSASPANESTAAIEEYLQNNPEVRAAFITSLGQKEDSLFSIDSNSDGITLHGEYSGKEEKAKIEKYLTDNKDMVDKFNEIQALTNLEQARKNLSIDKNAIRKRVQMESLLAWFAGQGMAVDQLMQYGNGQGLFAAVGLNYTA